MMHFLVKSQKRLVSNVVIVVSFVNFFSPSYCYTKSSEDPILASLIDSNKRSSLDSGPGYTVNFNNVPIIEVIRFVSKITNMNFVFNDDEIQFNVTIVSEEPISVKNIMSALIQVLRINELVLLEQDNNLIITKNTAVNQIATIVSGDNPESLNTSAPLITRVFRIKNASVSTVANVIRPLTSKAALIEVAAETRQLIVTDISTNVDKISTLLSSLDTPNTHLEIDSYIVKNVPVKEIISISNQILTPFTEGNPLIFVPQTETNTIFIVSTPHLIEKALTVIEDIDNPMPGVNIIPSSPFQSSIFVYKVLNRNPTDIIKSLQDVETQLEATSSRASADLIQALKTAKYVPDTSSIIFITSTDTWNKVKELLAGIDVTYSNIPGGSILFAYKVKNTSEIKLLESLEETTRTSQDKELLRTIKDAQLVKENHTIVFNGSQDAINKIQSIISLLDTAEPISNASLKGDFFIYTPEYVSGEKLLKTLQNTADTLEKSGFTNPAVLSAMESVKWVPSTNSLIFIGDTNSIDTIKTILKTIDIPDNSSRYNESSFFIYTPKYQTGQGLYNTILETAEGLKKSGLSDPSVISTLESVKWVPSTHSIVLSGNKNSITLAAEIITKIDNPENSKSQTETFIYKPVNITKDQLQEALSKFSSSLDQKTFADKNVFESIKQAQWIPENQSFVFRGSPQTISELKGIIASIDVQSQKGIQKGFFLYKLKNASGNLILEDLKNIANLMSESDPSNKSIQKAVANVKWVKETNSLLITGTSSEIEEVKAMIDEIDVPEKASRTVSVKSEFYIFKPIYQTPKEIVESLNNLANDLRQAGLIDADLLHTMSSARAVPSSQTILFTGTSDSIEKLKAVLVEVDTLQDEPTVQKIGDVNFIIYKIKFADPAVLLNSVKNFGLELSKSNIHDKELAKTISSAKYIKETNSILFTGAEDTLEQAEKVAEKFDIAPATASREPGSSYVVYNPKSQTGEELISILCDFMFNLQNSGVSDTALFDTISHLKFIDKTNSLIITGSQDSIDKVEKLLVKFDVPSKDQKEPSIASIDSANFLIYKLQYHKGSSIQAALKEIAVSLNKTTGAENKKIVDAISSLQWIQVTNSLLGTGDPEVLTKLKELIESVDVPLRQVFIEVLVIETTLNNSQTFGLQWGSQMQYLNRTIGSMGNFPFSNLTPPIIPPTIGPAGNILQAPLANTTASNPPQQGTSTGQKFPTTVPFVPGGFDLGIIGDIVLHKGRSFISLGSLLNALQVDNDTTVVMNPKIVTQDGHTSTLFVGQNIPFIGSYVNNVSSNTTTTSNIEYRDVGVSLTITPTLGTNNIVTLDINQDLSQALPNQSIGNANVNGIQTTHKTMSTRVHVPNGHFLVLSGMINDTKNTFKTSIPCLGGLPVVGALFSQSDRSTFKGNTIVFLRPFIIDSVEEYDRLTEEEEAMFKESASFPRLKEEFDAGAEMIKALSSD